MRKNKLLIIGAGGHGKVIADIALKLERYKCVSFLDDKITGEPISGVKVIGHTSDIHKFTDEYEFGIGIGDNKIRQQFFKQLLKLNQEMPVLMHPSVVLGEDIEIGAGTVLMAGVVLNSSTKLGKGCIINTSSSIDHDCEIRDFCHISPGSHVAGNVLIDNLTWLGIGSIIRNNIKITSDTIIGAGAVVVNDITEPGIYVGVPAKKKSKFNTTGDLTNVYVDDFILFKHVHNINGNDLLSIIN